MNVLCQKSKSSVFLKRIHRLGLKQLVTVPTRTEAGYVDGTFSVTSTLIDYIYCSSIGSPKRRVECTKCFQISIYIKLAPFLCHLSRAASTQLKSSVDIYRIYLRLATISQLTNIRLRQNAKYFAHVNKT